MSASSIGGVEQQRRCSTAPSSVHSERPGAMQIMQWVDNELQVNGLQGLEPSVERVRVFSSALREVIDMLPSYRPFLLALQKEYDGLIQRLQLEFNAIAPLEGRLKTLKAESLSFVGESMTWFQMEISVLRRRLQEVEDDCSSAKAARDKLEQESKDLREASERDKFVASESHLQNLDILKHLERCEKQVELLRKQEKELHGQSKELERKVKVREDRIQTVEEQLNEEREKLYKMVPREDCEALKEDIRHWEAKYQELTEQKERLNKDYLNIVETYTKRTGQILNLSGKDEMRPLTPRPIWQHCRGLLDPEAPHSLEKAELAQELLSHFLSCSRTLLSAYGLAVASQKSNVFKTYALHPLAAPLAGGEDSGRRKAKSKDSPATEEGGEASALLTSSTTSAGDGTRAKSGESGRNTKSSAGPGAKGEASSADDGWLSSDNEEDTPEPLRHKEKVKNLRFSRKKVADFIEGVMHTRARQGSTAWGTPFLTFMISGLNEEMGEERAEEAKDFAVNIYVAVRRYSAEPDFLAYLLMLLGKLPDTAVRDNKTLCAELLRIFTTHFETGDGTSNITKQKFFYGLREVLQNKDQKMWQDLVTYFPAGPADVLVNFEWLLLDDPYILSPIVYALRLQHLEEVLAMVERLEKTVRELPGSSNMVKYEEVETALKDDQEFALLQAEDYSKAFGTPVIDLRPTTEQEVTKFLEIMKHGEIFHALFFPVLPSDDAELPQVEM